MNEVVKHLVEVVKGIQEEKGSCVLAIDGRCASGKSTLAKQLAEQLSCPVFMMDDFFLRLEQRTEQRYQEPGGNVDRERFLEEVLQPLSKKEAVVYQPFDCQIFELTEPRTIPWSPITIIEGSYSCHPDLIGYYDYKVFLDITPELQMKRILQRNGEEKSQQFLQRWIPLEEKYFTHFVIRDVCDEIIHEDRM